MERSKITVVENKDVCFQLEYYLLKSGKESCGIEAVKKCSGEILEEKTVFLEDSDAEDAYRWITRLAESFVTPVVLEEILREVIILDYMEGLQTKKVFPLCS